MHMTKRKVEMAKGSSKGKPSSGNIYKTTKPMSPITTKNGTPNAPSKKEKGKSK